MIDSGWIRTHPGRLTPIRCRPVSTRSRRSIQIDPGPIRVDQRSNRNRSGSTRIRCGLTRNRSGVDRGYSCSRRLIWDRPGVDRSRSRTDSHSHVDRDRHGGGGSIRDRPGPSRGRPAVGPRSGIDPGPIRIDQESTWCRFGIDAGRFRVDPGSILGRSGLDLQPAIDQESIGIRYGSTREQPDPIRIDAGSRSGSARDRSGLDPQSAIDPGSIRGRSGSIWDRSGVDPDRQGSLRGGPRIGMGPTLTQSALDPD